MSAPLAGYVVAVTAERRRHELGEALARHGAQIVYAPAIRVVPLADDLALRRATEALIADHPDVVVTTTAVGFRGWLEAAGEWGLDGPLLDALRGADVLTRGPKVRGAVRASGLRETWSPAGESSDEVFAHLARNYRLAGCRIAVQLHGDPLTALLACARDDGAEIVEVPVYRWEPPADPQPLRALVQRVAAGRIDAITLTSAPAASSLLACADDLGVGEEFRAHLGVDVVCFAVGPVTAAPLRAAGIEVLEPQRHRLGALVREVVERLPERGHASSR